MAGNSIYESLNFHYWILFLGGCLNFLYINGKLMPTLYTLVYTYAARIGLLSCFILALAIKFNDNESSSALFDRLPPVSRIILFSECFSCPTIYILNFVMMDRQSNAHMHWLEDMLRLDHDIVQEFQHVHMNYDKTCKKYTYAAIAIFVIYGLNKLVFIIGLANCSCGYISTFLIFCSYGSMASQIISLGYLHVALLDYLRLRYRLIQTLLGQLYAQRHEYEDKNMSLPFARIISLFEYAKRCANQTKQVNYIFGFVSGFCMFSDFAVIISFTFLICQRLIANSSGFLIYLLQLWVSALHSYKIIMTGIYGHYLEREIKCCHHMLNKFGDYYYHVPVMREYVQQFYFWKMHNQFSAKIGLTAHCGLSLIYKIFNGIANYVIILIQLRYQQNVIEKAIEAQEAIYIKFKQEILN